MRIPILVTMAWPQRLPCSEQFCPRLDFVKMGNLTFKAPDDAKYPAMNLAYAAGRAGGTMTGVLSAANEQVCCWDDLDTWEWFDQVVAAAAISAAQDTFLL